MPQVPERFRSAAARQMVALPGLPPRHARRAIVQSLYTAHHARQCLERTAELLGDRVWHTGQPGDCPQALYLREGDWISVAPLLHWKYATGLGRSVPSPKDPRPDWRTWLPADAPDDWTPDQPHWDPEPPAPQILPRGADMHGGYLSIALSGSHFDIGYNDKGLFCEAVVGGGDSFSDWYFGGSKPHQWDPAARPPQRRPLALLLRGDLDPRGWPTDRMAQLLAELALAAPQGPRVRMPVEIPGGPARIWAVAMQGAMRALSQSPVPETARWLVVDGFAGTAVACGASREEADTLWQSEVARLRPKPAELKQQPQQSTQLHAERRKTTASHDARLRSEIARLEAEDRANAGNVRPLRKPGVDTATGDIVGKDGKVKGKSLGTFDLQFGAGGIVGGGTPQPVVPWPLPTPTATPSALIALTPPPPLPVVWRDAGFTERLCMLDDQGELAYAFRRTEPDGWTAVGAHLLPDLEPQQLDKWLWLAQSAAAADLAQMPNEFQATWTMHAERCTRYWLRSGAQTDRERLAEAGSMASDVIVDAQLDWQTSWQVVRLRRSPNATRH